MSWIETFHDVFLVKTLLLRTDPKLVEADIEFLERALSLTPAAKVLDQCWRTRS